MKSKISSYFFLGALTLVLPAVAFAGGEFTGTFFFNITDFLARAIRTLFPLVTGALILLFGYQLVMFLVSKKDDIEDAAKFKKRMINSIIAIFLWFVLFGLITVVADAIGLNVGDDVTKDETTGVDFTPNVIQ